ncbi:hypothetical protein [Desulfoluna sp.]|uniref:hypothetical protein n=1 Tax=Desulfoluna sp. TaxID=2045199 RepID=UPI00261AA692|nr:hypothetical protein [Desulfoluna sp.]
MKFNEFINTDFENFQVIFNYYLEFLEELSSKKFPFENVIKIKGAGGKFLNTIEKISYIPPPSKEKYMGLVDEVLDESRNYRQYADKTGLYKFLFPNHTIRILSRLQDSFQKLYSDSLELINDTTSKLYHFDELKLNDFFKPENSNKDIIKNLVNEAIDLIKEDESLTEKSKKIIIEYLEKALKELDYKYVNWTKFIGRIKETVIVLGALGSLIGGAGTLYNAHAKLEQVTETIQKTSVNINYTVLNETFNAQYIQNIGSINTFIKLPEKTDSEIKDKVKISNIVDIN